MNETHPYIAVKDRGNERHRDLPLSVFAQAAEQLRWDALRCGYLKARDWHAVTASVAPVELDGEPPTRAFALALELHGAARPVRRVYRADELQAASLYLETVAPVAPPGDLVAELHWPDGRRLNIPLAPLALPIDRVPDIAPRRDPLPLRVVVSCQAQRDLRRMGRQSVELGTELGGCLHGRLRDLDTLEVVHVARAPDGGGSDSDFAFAPAFWAEAGRPGRGRRMVGWVHSHLCDRGHPRGLTGRDLVVAHRFFASPWSVAALLCCASDPQPAVLWFGWQDGALLKLGDGQVCQEG